MTTALITGAAGHLGSVITRDLAIHFDHIAVNDIDALRATSLADSIANAEAFVADVADVAGAQRLIDDVHDRFGTIDVVVNGAGVVGPIGPIESLDATEVEHVFSVNALSMFWVCRAAVPHLKTGGGRIVNLASGAGLAGGAFASAYHASKHAVVGLTRSLARELGPHGISVNAICPGYVDSPMVERIVARLEELSGTSLDVASGIPVGRMATPSEVAETVRFLAVEAPSSMTGSCLVLDGAMRA